MGWLYGTGFMQWFWATWLATMLFWPVPLFLSNTSTNEIDLLALVAAPFISLPVVLPLGLMIAATAFLPAVFGWWLARRLTAWAGIGGGLAASAAGIIATICALALPTWFSGMMSGKEPEGLDLKAFIYFIVSLAGPVAAIAGPFVALTLTRERFPRP
ncbi:hypothetical protein RAH32_02195 [Paracoccus sp. WLY502]|uniref:hypothetical protein n=1 Tax=Paracoccus yibinensis TaxID=3068891 RepID=UPI002796DFCD|nr:hypothetical protein [Paracoccus sp. WLY502]MDQ1899255.1 hypothetical protein [Paracoccus sp. WLY502]